MSCRRWTRAGLAGALGGVLALGGLVTGMSATAAPPDPADLRAALQDVTYPPPTVVPLPDVVGNSTATAVSDSGVVAGWRTRYSAPSWSWFSVWRWGGSRFEELDRQGYPVAVDDTGRVLVRKFLTSSDAFLWEADGTVTQIFLGGSATDASMSPHGIIAGTVFERAYVVRDGVARRIDPSRRETRVAPAQGVNDAGQVVGSSRAADGSWRAFLWQDGALRYLDTPDGAGSHGLGINARGQVLAVHDALGAVVWEPDGTVRRLDPSGAGFRPLRIDDRGVAVGWVPAASDPSRQVPAVADADGVRRLPGLGASLGSVREIAPNGLVVGTAPRTSWGWDAPVAWVAGLPVPLGLTPAGGAEALTGEPYDVSSGGRVVGELVHELPDTTRRRTAVVWDLVPQR